MHFRFIAVVLLACIAAPSLPAAVPVTVDDARELSETFADVVDRVAPAVVYITTEQDVAVGPRGRRQAPPGMEEFFERFFDRPDAPEAPQQQPRQRRRMGQGSGFIISNDGYVLTNHHVAGEADVVKVRLLDGREFTADVVGSDERSDVALVKIEGSDLPTIDLGSSANSRVGEWVMAVGAPFGLTHTVTAGIISAKGRDRVGIVDYENFIQTDAAINPGNSGGPLINMSGEVIGINTAIYSRTGGSMGIGFAIPVDMVKPIADQLRETGSVRRGFLGVGIQDLTPEMAEALSLDTTKGVMITDVMPESAAANAGIQSGDVVVSFQGLPAVDAGSFRNAVALLKPGAEVEMEVIREGERKNVEATLGSREDAAIAQQPENSEVGELGIELEEVTEAIAEKLEYADSGLLITAVEDDSPAADAGLEPGLVIQRVGSQDVTDIVGFRTAVDKVESGKPILLLVRTQRGSRFLTITKP